jgi:cystathionine beta-lyase
MKTATQCVHPPRGNDPHGAISPPIYQTATFRQPTATEFGDYDYSRSGNPTRTILEEQLALLEKGRHAFAFASGMAAITTLTRLLQAGDEILAGDDLYGGTYRLLGKVLPRLGISVRCVDTSDLAATARAFSPKTKLVLIETPTNPLLRITDVHALAALAHDHGARLAVDNSLLSPILQQPLELGADLVIHSATKFLCGHSDVSAGAVIVKDDVLAEQIGFIQNAEGAALSPFESWLLLRGLKTLSLRVERQCASAQKVAEFLDRHPKVKQVYFPGLPDHPGRALHRRQSSGDGAVLAFTTGDFEFSKRIVEATKIFTIAVSFGSVGSVITLPGRMSHASTPPEIRALQNLPDDLVRISVGIEDVEDLLEDLAQALTAANVTVP